MEIVYALAVGILSASGVWLVLRPRTFQVVVGITLLSYAVNLFIFGTGRLFVGASPIIDKNAPTNTLLYADPIPQALVLTAIVIGFAMTALMLVLIMVQRGLTGYDHVDGGENPHVD